MILTIGCLKENSCWPSSYLKAPFIIPILKDNTIGPTPPAPNMKLCRVISVVPSGFSFTMLSTSKHILL
jgi:hypothetical protein